MNWHKTLPDHLNKCNLFKKFTQTPNTPHERANNSGYFLYCCWRHVSLYTSPCIHKARRSKPKATNCTVVWWDNSVFLRTSSMILHWTIVYIGIQTPIVTMLTIPRKDVWKRSKRYLSRLYQQPYLLYIIISLYIGPRLTASLTYRQVILFPWICCPLP